MIDPVLQADLTDITSQLKILRQRVEVLEKTVGDTLQVVDRAEREFKKLRGFQTRAEERAKEVKNEKQMPREKGK